jgi:hypothetical protein
VKCVNVWDISWFFLVLCLCTGTYVGFEPQTLQKKQKKICTNYVLWNSHLEILSIILVSIFYLYSLLSICIVNQIFCDVSHSYNMQRQFFFVFLCLALFVLSPCWRVHVGFTILNWCKTGNEKKWLYSCEHLTGEKVGEGHMCLWCGEKGKTFHSIQAVQKHMLDKGHCKINFDRDTALEFADFYDYRCVDFYDYRCLDFYDYRCVDFYDNRCLDFYDYRCVDFYMKYVCFSKGTVAVGDHLTNKLTLLGEFLPIKRTASHTSPLSTSYDFTRFL